MPGMWTSTCLGRRVLVLPSVWVLTVRDGQKMDKIFVYDWPYKSLNLYFLSDWHWGSPQCQSDKVKEVIRAIREDPLGRFVCLGDLVENSLIGTLGDVYEQTEPPRKQVEMVSALLKPIANKCWGFISGNHGYRTQKIASINPDQVIAHQAGLGDKWAGISFCAVIRVNQRVFKLFAHHTTGGGRTKGGKINALSRMAEIMPLCDIYVGAHDHSEMFCADRVFEINTNGKPAITPFIRRFFRSGSLLDYSGSYAERKMSPPAQMGQLVITLYGALRRGRRRKKTHSGLQPRKIEWKYIPEND